MVPVLQFYEKQPYPSKEEATLKFCSRFSPKPC
jgi:hypothetical protein